MAPATSSPLIAGAGADARELGYWCPVLHAHLPFVRHPEYQDFLEEDWLYEAITETYVPLLRVLRRPARGRRRLPADHVAVADAARRCCDDPLLCGATAATSTS